VKVTVRNPVALWLVVVITLGIWGAVWWYQINRELRDYSRAVKRPLDNSPVLATVLFALWPLALIPAIVTVVFTAGRIRTVQEWFGAKGVSRVIAALLLLVLFLHAFYLQRALNDLWRRAEHEGPPPPDYAVASGQEQRLASEVRTEADRDAFRWR
jgi:Na+/H+ antiporter NhaC